MTTTRRLALALLAAMPLLPVPPALAGARADSVYAAASLSVVLDGLVPAYRAATGRELRVTYAASGTLARQIEGGAPADAFLSADNTWMDYLALRNLIDNDTRQNLLGNALVLVAPAGSTTELAIARGFALDKSLGGGRLSIGDPDSVPAGKYAKAALESLGAWDSVADHLVRGDSVRTALVFVERGEAPLGIVYLTDARDDPKVRIVGQFPAGSHPPIVYPVAMVHGHQAGSEALLAFLRGPVASAAFEKHGFAVLR